MERILILMQAANWAEATEALTSARENALHRNALSYALVLPEAPTSPEECNMAAFGALQYLVSPEMTFAAMETLWHGERYALLAHPAMRFERDWEKKLLRALNDCPVENAQAVLTGYLPAQDDPIGAVCPVAAERIDPDGTLCFAHGMPLTLAAHPMPGAFLHPDFFFARAGFIRAMAQGSGTAFLRAMVQGWQCCTLNQPVITLTHDLPAPPARIDPQEDGLAQLKEEYGVDFAAGTLSAAAKRGLKSNSLDMTLAVTPLMRIKSAVQRRRRKRTDPMPLCVTVCPASLDEEGMHWLRQLTQMQDLALLCYAEGLKSSTRTCWNTSRAMLCRCRRANRRCLAARRCSARRATGCSPARTISGWRRTACAIRSIPAWRCRGSGCAARKSCWQASETASTCPWSLCRTSR